MRLSRWRKYVHDLIHHFLLLTVVFVFFFSLIVSLLHFTLPWLPAHPSFVTQSLNQLLGARTRFSSIQIGWYELKPEIELRDVTLSNKNGKDLMEIPELNLRFSLFKSLLNAKLALNFLEIKKWQIFIYQTEDHHWFIAGTENFSFVQENDHEVPIASVLSVLKQIDIFRLENCHIIIQPYHQKKLELLNANLEGQHELSQLKIRGDTFIRNFNRGHLSFISKIWDLDSWEKSSAELYFKFNPIELKSWLSFLPLSNFGWKEGVVSGQLWLERSHGTWENFLSQLHFENLYLQKNDINFAIHTLDLKLIGNSEKIKLYVLGQNQGEFFWPKIFRMPLEFNKIEGQGTLTFNHGLLQGLDLQPIVIQTTAGKIQAEVHLNWLHDVLKDMQIFATLNFHDIKKINLYLPAGIMSPPLVKWLDDSILNVKTVQAKFFWRGLPKDFPFKNQLGTMQIFSHLEDATLNYDPDWPVLKHLNADLYFTTQGMHLIASQGLLGSLPIDHVSADILFKKNTQLVLYGKIRGAINQTYEFLKNTPLKNTFSFLLNHTQSEGQLDLELGLQLPLYKTDILPTYQGKLNLIQDQLESDTKLVSFNNISGQINFDDQKIQGNLTLKWLDFPWHLVVNKSDEKSPLNFNFDGVFPMGSWFATHFPIATNWAVGNPEIKGAMQMKDHETVDLHLTTQLEKTKLDFPLGIHKLEKIKAPLNFHWYQSDSDFKWQLDWQLAEGLVQAVGNQHDCIFNTPLFRGNITFPTQIKPVWQINLINLDLRYLSKDSFLNTANSMNKNFPPMDISINKILFDHHEFQSLITKLRPTSEGMDINELVLQDNEFSLESKGKNNAGKTNLEGKINIKNLDHFLKIFDFNPFVISEDTTINFKINWLGSLWQFAWHHLRGDITFNTGKGLFSNISKQTNNKINLGRILSLLSLNELPHHLSNHFNDMTQEGFYFSHSQGSFLLAPNMLKNINIDIHGVVAQVMLHGCVDTEFKTLNLLGEINPNLTGSLPMVVAMAGGPLAGAASFLANQLLEPLIGHLSGSYYSIEGAWDNPHTSKITSAQAISLLRGGVCRGIKSQ